MELANEKEIERALEAEALGYEPPNDLRGQILAEAGRSSENDLGSRIRKWRAAKFLGTDSPSRRWVSVGALATILLGLYTVGQVMAPKHLPDALRAGPDAPSVLPSSNSGPDCAEGNCGGTVHKQASGSPAEAGAGGSGGSGGGQLSGAGSSQGQSVSAPAFGPGVVRTGEVEVRVKKGSFTLAWEKALNIASNRGGFVATSSAEQVKGRLSRGTLTLRIPASNLDGAMADFRRLGRPVRLRTSSADVSGQLVDYEARLRSAQAREIQLLELLKQSKSLPDSLQVSSPLAEVRTQIESLQAQKANLQNQVELASLTASLHEPQAALNSDGGAARGWLAKALEQAGDASSSTVSTILVGAGFVLPILVIGMIAWVALNLRRRTALR